MVSRHFKVILLAAMLAVAAAFGAVAVEPKEAEAANTTSVRGCTGGKVELTSAEKKMLDLHNRERADRGLSRLCVHPALQKAARAYSAEMIQKDYFKHGNVASRLNRVNYDWRTYGENIAYGGGSYASPENRFRAWMNSPGHRANILNKSFREVGIGARTGNFKGDNVTMWTADFGAR